MSNSAIVSVAPESLPPRDLLTKEQGTLYKRIIDNVVDTSRADFEENGVPHGTMGTFQEVCCQHLTF